MSPAPSLDPERDMAEQGLFSSIARYWLLERREKTPTTTPLPSIRTARSRDLPDIVVIQSESFFDARRLFPGIRREVLSDYDISCANAAWSGRLEVPAWGANTMRPEFAFLTGLPPQSLGIHRFNPYRRVTRRPLRALPAVLREAGYHTTCIHPHPARFFRRDRAFPYLGFERFIDMRQFCGAKKAGPYISDEAVTDKLLQELREAGRPSFFFVITMENHGPLHLEKTRPGESEELYSNAPPSNCQDLTIYLRHLRNADMQLGRLRKELKERSRPTIFCFYGEHLPSMPVVYGTLGIPDGKTDYFLELPLPPGRLRRDIKVEELSGMILGSLNE
jgi:phosphoglycerol transferase MdoB-like AlkP superfamily enzyme